MTHDVIVANGIDGRTGEYLLPPLTPRELARRALQSPAPAETTSWLRRAWSRISQPFFGLPFTLDPADIASSGWALVLGADESPLVRRALEPLVEHRRHLAHDRVQVLEYRAGESWLEWLHRHGVAPGSVEPQKVPYYICLVGAPARIPFEFQYLLDVEYAVGRVDLDDPDAYGRYAQSIVACEKGGSAPHDSAAVFFGTRHPFDRATQLSADQLVRPLADSFGPGGRFETETRGAPVHVVCEERATKQTLRELVQGDGPLGRPALLFTATHGLGGWPPGDPDQRARHGALVCQDWPGLGRIDAESYFSADDVPADARVLGTVAFLFACYGAGTPKWDAFAPNPGHPRSQIADEPFVAELPKRLLGHPEGGALAVIGHVERVWGYSFLSAGTAQLLPFQNAIGRILAGQPVGLAMKDFNERYAALSTNISDTTQQIRYGKVVADEEFVQMWTERNDAQNYVLLGDPAVALRRA